MSQKPNHKLRVYNNITQLIANIDNPTPLVKLNRINPNLDFEIYAKLEWYNPFGSIKDRIAKKMLEGIKDKKIIEASSGNTAIALTAIANVLNIPVEIAVPKRIPEEKKSLLRLLDAILWEAEDDLCPLYPHEGARGLARQIYSCEDEAVYTNQYENEANVQTHYESTGPEIWKQTKGNIDFFIAGYGTTGTLTGAGRYLKKQKPSVKIIGIEPTDVKHNLPGMKNISKLSEEYIPKILDRSVIDESIAVTDDEAYKTAVDLARKEGLLVGPTTGAVAFAALKIAERGEKGLAVIISADNAFKYTSFYSSYVKSDGKPKI